MSMMRRSPYGVGPSRWMPPSGEWMVKIGWSETSGMRFDPLGDGS
jgi:hypothetical protein